MKVALITGITGQDGSYLAEFLLDKDYVVYGIVRPSSCQLNTHLIDSILEHKNLILKRGDVTDVSCIQTILKEISERKEAEVIEIYNLAAQSHVKVSFEVPLYTVQVDAVGPLNILESVRMLNILDKTRFYQASSSEMYGQVMEIPQTETTPFYPRSPYGVSKLCGYWLTKNYRESYNMFACNGILFNHESPRRGYNFVTRKITIGLGRILKGEMDYITLGNIDSKRDWGHAKDYVRAMWMMLQHNVPDDYVVSTNEQHSVREFTEKSFALRGTTIVWEGEGVDEVGKCKETGETRIKIDSKYFRPAEVDTLLGDCTKIKETLGWIGEHSFDDLVKEMVESDC